ncbi:MAG: 30S ribosomal protein S6 [Candidatus Buchananbacteria bacterium]|nr:30S ribosomal protein S6 [Candidatus Buchananbacteria bacterium]
MTNHYELLYLVAANYTEEELEPIKQKVADEIKKFGGQITLEESLGKKKLAYPISKNHQGYYLLYEFDLEGSKLKDLSRNLKLSSELLRHIIVKRSLSRKTVIKTNITKAKPALTSADGASKPADEKAPDDKDRLKLEDLDQKLDQILEGDIM